MTGSLKKKLTKLAEKHQVKGDPSHDFHHILRVLNLAVQIAKRERADMDVVIPAALFHDVVVYRKDTKKSKMESDESAQIAGKILDDITSYPKQKIDKVLTCIRQCSFSKGITPSLLEAKILQDADRLEATGAISIMRTFSSGGQMKRPFYDPHDPFRTKSVSEKFGPSLDLFYQRLLRVEKTMHTNWAKKIARRRTRFLKTFLSELKTELSESAVIKRSN
ncbi:MAG: HD domain-containing protein [Candidatus Liptonbacteria bacterium]|nr:HD domain-containing protein [Candidatus Liptonbacteria bacterium]